MKKQRGKGSKTKRHKVHTYQIKHGLNYLKRSHYEERVFHEIEMIPFPQTKKIQLTTKPGAECDICPQCGMRSTQYDPFNTIYYCKKCKESFY